MCSSMRVSTALVREAFDASGEKHFLLARALYSLLFGRDWGQAILGFGYLKCLDDLVDEDPDVERALAVLARQTDFIRRVYEHDRIDRSLVPPERFGLPFFVYDRNSGGRLRHSFEAILATMEFDTRRRGVVLDEAELDAYFVELGSAVLRFLVFFGAPGFDPPPAFMATASRAYLIADSIIDVRHDLRLGVINLSREDVERFGLTLEAEDPLLLEWMKERAGAVLELFSEALSHGRRLDRRSLRFLSKLYLSTKRRKLCRFLAREGFRAEAPLHAAAARDLSGRI